MPKPKDTLYNIDDFHSPSDQVEQEDDFEVFNRQIDSAIDKTKGKEMFEGVSSVPDAPLSQAQESFLEQKTQSGYQCPIKGDWKNLGEFSPNAATDPRHPSGHQGVDLQAEKGTPIYPLAPGVVSKTGSTPKSGNSVTITHDDEVKTFYAHCDTVKVKEGDEVDYDTVIATVGNTGNAKDTSPHLHFQVWKNGQLKNPGEFFTVPRYVPAKQSNKYFINMIIKKANLYYRLTKF